MTAFLRSIIHVNHPKQYCNFMTVLVTVTLVLCLEGEMPLEASGCCGHEGLASVLKKGILVTTLGSADQVISYP